MSVDFTGITNGNEFYTDFYLATVFQDDLKNRAKGRDDADDSERSDRRLNSLREKFFALDARLAKSNDRAETFEEASPFVREILQALGYSTFTRAKLCETATGASLPIVAEFKRSDGAPWLWAIEIAPDVRNDAKNDADDAEISTNPTTKPLIDEQFADEPDPKRRLTKTPVEELISREIFALDEPPRFVLLVRFDDVVLLDRSKWNDKRFLRFDLREILGRREPTTLAATAALLERRSVCPDSGSSALDEFNENSDKHATSVSEDLKYAARKAVELMGNEAVYYMRRHNQAVFSRDEDELAKTLTTEALRYLYRLLFLFFLEARSAKLDYLPTNNEAYRTGYSLESLRDLEMARASAESADGFFFDNSLRTLFKMVFDGCYPSGKIERDDLMETTEAELPSNAPSDPLRYEFRIERLECALFDPSRTPTLDGVKFRNSVWQEIIRLLSLSGEKTGKKGRRGRVSYANLGVSQLGAVYEGLLSYRGFFAKTDLYEVKKADDKWDELKQGYFVTEEEFENYDENERVVDSDGNFVVHKKGEFVYRLAGRDREKSASYYTPNSLTKLLVEYSLKELIGEKKSDPNYKTADEILELTVCEPAMGSAAFLNEAINQLADAYIKRKQIETGETIPSENLERETQKVRSFLADRNVFGVDLNPIAVELGEISLWLNAISGERKGLGRGVELFVPWFGGQLVCGNSLVGARRQVYPSAALYDKKTSWADAEPIPVEPGRKRPKGTVYQFLIPDPGMAAYDDKVVKSLEKRELEKFNAWRKDFVKPFAKDDVVLLERLSDGFDRLWEECADDMRRFRDETTDALSIFGREDAKRRNVPLREKEERLGELHTKRIKNSTPYRRLKWAMDYWCALWFWPIGRADDLPNREEYLFELQYVFQGELMDEYVAEIVDGERSLIPNERRAEQIEQGKECGNVDVDDLDDKFPRLRIVEKIASEQHFLHWELEFADLFADRGGFDLIVGNPPWVKVEWHEEGILSDYDPSLSVKKLSASQTAELRGDVFESAPESRDAYLQEYVSQTGCKNFLNAFVNYPALKGSQTNLFKCFLPTAWRNVKNDGVFAFVHPEGVYDDPNGGRLRKEIYSRLRYHFQFINARKLFKEIDSKITYSVNIYGGKRPRPGFKQISNAFATSTVVESLERRSPDKVAGIKNDENDWNLAGHQDRAITITEKELATFAKLYDAPGTPPDEARLPTVHAVQLLDVLEKFAEYPKRLGDIQGEYRSTVMWDETNAVKKDHTIRRETRFPKSPDELILSGPHFYVGNPHNKTPREKCKLNSAYDVIDLTRLPEDYSPRTNYVPDCSPEEYRRRTPDVPWDSSKKVTDYYRVCFRAMLSQAGERTLIGAVCPKGVGHVNGVQSTCFKDSRNLILLATLSSSLVADFFIKSTGKANLHFLWTTFPRFDLTTEMSARCLLLNCLTRSYADLWSECWDGSFVSDGWATEDERLPSATFSRLTGTWSPDYPLRSDFSRRQALLELDVLVARALGLTLDELCAIYRIQFPVLRQNDADTWYDRDGRIVFTCSKGLTGVGFSRAEWNEIKDSRTGVFRREVVDAWLPDAPTRTIEYRAPFDRRDREADYKTIWEYFDKRG